MDQITKYKCAKCGNSQYTMGKMWVPGNLIIRFMGFQNRRFNYISCTMCHYTEFYVVPGRNKGEPLKFSSH